MSPTDMQFSRCLSCTPNERRCHWNFYLISFEAEVIGHKTMSPCLASWTTSVLGSPVTLPQATVDRRYIPRTYTSWGRGSGSPESDSEHFLSNMSKSSVQKQTERSRWTIRVRVNKVTKSYESVVPSQVPIDALGWHRGLLSHIRALRLWGGLCGRYMSRKSASVREVLLAW